MRLPAQRILSAAALLAAVAALGLSQRPSHSLAEPQPTAPASSEDAIETAFAADGPASPTASDPSPLAAQLPPSDGPLWPALTRVSAGIAGRGLLDVDACEGCHADAAAQWQTSAHAFSSFNNPIYRASIDGVRRRAGHRASRMCAGCHDLSLLVDGAMDAPVRPADVRAHAGITCRMCHGAVSAGTAGNGSLTLGAPLSLPRRDDSKSIRAHRAEVKTARVGNDLCVACHRSFVGPATGNAHHLAGMDEASAWQGSPYAGQGSARVDVPLPPRDCIGCHMAREAAGEGDVSTGTDGRIASHRFLGGHTYLAAMRGDADQLARAQAFLRGVASIDVAAVAIDDGPRWLLADGSAASPLPADALSGRSLELDVVLRNLAVGHRFPGGVLDAQDTWVEVCLLDANGVVLASSGTLAAEARAATDDAADARHILRALAVGMDGAPRLLREVDELAAVVTNSSIGPRDVVSVRYRFVLPDRPIAAPLQVRARLLHRSRNAALQAAACEADRAPRGRGFARVSARLFVPRLDPCVPQPVTVIARSGVWLDRRRAAWPRGEPQPAAPGQRLYEHGLSLSHGLGEELSSARPSLLAALRLAVARGPGEGSRSAAPSRASVAAALANLAARQGLVAVAQEWLARARVDLPTHPALLRIEADAFTRVWQFEAALPPLRALVDRTPRSPDALHALARTLGSLGRDREAAAVAARGLRLQPHHVGLLRVQAVSLAALAAPEAAAALTAYDRVDRGEEAGRALRFACGAARADCAMETRPLHAHQLAP